MTEFQSLVRQRFRSALIWSTAAKITTCLLQVISIPIAIKYLGKEGFVAYTALYALSLAPQAFVLRHGPSLTGPGAVLFARNQWQQIREKLWSAVVPSGVSAFVAGLGLAVWLGVFGIPVSLNGETSGTLMVTLAVLAIVNVLNTWVLVFDDMQAAFQETHLQGIRVTLGNVVALLATLVIVPSYPSLLVYSIAVTVPPIAIRLMNVGLMMSRYHDIRPRAGAITRDLVGHAIRNSLMYTLVVGVGTYASFRLPVIASANYLGVDETTSISIINQLVLVGYVFGSILSAAFVPAINASIAEGDSHWVHRSVRRIEYLLLAASAMGTIAFCAIGPMLHRYFVKEDLHVSTYCLFFAGVYTALMVVENFYYLVGLSFQPSIKLSVLFVVRALLTGAFALIACANNFPTGIWLSGCVLTIAMTIFSYRHMVYAYLEGLAMEHSDSGLDTTHVAATQKSTE